MVNAGRDLYAAVHLLTVRVVGLAARFFDAVDGSLKPTIPLRARLINAAIHATAVAVHTGD